MALCVVAGLLGWTRDFSPQGLETAIRGMTRDDGFDGVSFFFHYPLDELPEAARARLRDLAGELEIVYAVHGPFHDENIGSHYENIRRASVADICAALDFAAAIGAQTVTFHPKMTRYGADSSLRSRLLPRAREQEARSLGEIAGHAQRLGVIACYENMDPTEVHYPENVEPAGVLALAGPYLDAGLGITFDPAHANVGGHDPVAAARTLGQAIRHVHLNDNDGSYDQHLPLGRGTIDLPGVLDALRAGGYSGLLELELGPREEYLASREYLRQHCGV